MKNSVKLYSSAIPLWFLLFSPNTWLFLVLTQFIIVSLVLYAGLKHIDYPDPPSIWRKSIVWNTLYGFISYLLICAFFFLTHLVSEESALGVWVLEHIVTPLDTNPFSSLSSIIFVIVCLLICGLIAYFGNRKLAFNKTSLTIEQKHKISLFLAIFSAPYLALIPSILLYS